jgi:hypothetical protein
MGIDPIIRFQIVRFYVHPVIEVCHRSKHQSSDINMRIS